MLDPGPGLGKVVREAHRQAPLEAETGNSAGTHLVEEVGKANYQAAYSEGALEVGLACRWVPGCRLVGKGEGKAYRGPQGLLRTVS